MLVHFGLMQIGSAVAFATCGVYSNAIYSFLMAIVVFVIHSIKNGD